MAIAKSIEGVGALGLSGGDLGESAIAKLLHKGFTLVLCAVEKLRVDFSTTMVRTENHEVSQQRNEVDRFPRWNDKLRPTVLGIGYALNEALLLQTI